MYANSCGSVGAAGNLPGKYSRQYCGKEKIMKTITEITTKQPAAAILRLAPYSGYPAIPKTSAIPSRHR